MKNMYLSFYDNYTANKKFTNKKFLTSSEQPIDTQKP